MQTQQRVAVDSKSICDRTLKDEWPCFCYRWCRFPGIYAVLKPVTTYRPRQLLQQLCRSLTRTSRSQNFPQQPTASFQQGDIQITNPRSAFLDAATNNRSFDAVNHFAGVKAVGESVQPPLLGCQRAGSHLLATMDAHACRTLVFSSSATVYGFPDSVPISKQHPFNRSSPTAAAAEQMLSDLNASIPNTWRIASLRYSTCGRPPSGQPGKIPSHPQQPFPLVLVAAAARKLKVFGSDWPTHDGTGVRDYIHVMDLAENTTPPSQPYSIRGHSTSPATSAAATS